MKRSRVLLYDAVVVEYLVRTGRTITEQQETRIRSVVRKMRNVRVDEVLDELVRLGVFSEVELQ